MGQTALRVAGNREGNDTTGGEKVTKPSISEKKDPSKPASDIV